MLNLTDKRLGRPPLAVTVIDKDGHIEIFKSTKDVAIRLSVNRQTIYNAIHQKKRVRGCKIIRNK